MSDLLAVARGALLELSDVGAAKAALFETFQRELASIRHYVPEDKWASVANTLGDLRLYEERTNRVRQALRDALAGGN